MPNKKKVEPIEINIIIEYKWEAKWNDEPYQASVPGKLIRHNYLSKAHRQGTIQQMTPQQNKQSEGLRAWTQE